MWQGGLRGYVFRKGELTGQMPELRKDGRLCNLPLYHQERSRRSRLEPGIQLPRVWVFCTCLAASACGSLPCPHQSSRESLSCSQSINVTNSQPPRNPTLPVWLLTMLELQFQGIWYPLLASNGTAHTGTHTKILAK